MSSADYCPATPEDVREMLTVIGVSSIDDLFAPIPPHLRAESFDLPAGMSEFEMLDRLKGLALRNGAAVLPFVGGGCYDHVIPAVVDHLAGRAEFYTAYTLRISPNVHRGRSRPFLSTRPPSAASPGWRSPTLPFTTGQRPWPRRPS